MSEDANLREFTKSELYDEPFPWTIISGQVYAIGSFISEHPGGFLIRRAIGEDATELFLSHHCPYGPAAQVLERYKIGVLANWDTTSVKQLWERRPMQRRFWQRLAEAKVSLVAEHFEAEMVAVSMLILFAWWCYLSYVHGFWRLNLCFSWFWWRHLDAGLHAVMHGDFRTSRRIQGGLFWIYSLLSHRAMEYYFGSPALKGTGLSKHWWHHIYPNDPGRDPDWSTMTGVLWVRRHWSAQWHPCHRWQSWYWLPVTMFVEPMLELFQVTCLVLEAVASLLEPPMNGSYRARVAHLLGISCEMLLNPGFQLLSFLAQPFWEAFGVLLMARAISRLLLYPFSEVQHYMPEHIVAAEVSKDVTNVTPEWVVNQLSCTANLEFRSPLSWFLDFLMFHGDSHQIEHHLWPAMSFIQYSKASKVARETCDFLDLPYHSISLGSPKWWMLSEDLQSGE
eukprot:symbB.v1.2.002662.t1/scaffold138.1/size301272/3